MDGWFNGRLKSKKDLEKLSKQELIDNYWATIEQNQELITMIFKANKKDFEKMKDFWLFLIKEQKNETENNCGRF